MKKNQTQVKDMHKLATIDSFLEKEMPGFHLEVESNPHIVIATNGTSTIWIEHIDYPPDECEVKDVSNPLYEDQSAGQESTKPLESPSIQLTNTIVKKIPDGQLKIPFDKYGAGILLISVSDIFFPTTGLDQLLAKLKNDLPEILQQHSLGYIREIYLEIPTRVSLLSGQYFPHSFKHLISLSSSTKQALVEKER